MFLTTRCPHCGTAFEVAPDQLRIRGGWVRCGECAQVFDGNAGLKPPPPSAGETPPPVFADDADVAVAAVGPVDLDEVHTIGAAPEPEPSMPAVLRGRSARIEPVWRGPGDEEREAPLLRDPPGERWHDTPLAGPDEDDQDDPRALDEEEGRDDWTVRDDAGHPDDRDGDGDPGGEDDELDEDREDDDEDIEDDDESASHRIIAEPRHHARPRPVPDFMDDEADARRRLVRKLWAFAALLALLVLFFQAAMVFRVAIATAMPSLRPTLETLCRPLGCVVGYERRAERLSVTSSSLRPAQAGAVAEDAPSRLVLGVTLRNRYLHPQPWPALMLDLRDFSDTVVVRRALLPGEYLPPEIAGQPLAAGAEINLSIPLTVTGVRVSGYQVGTFHP